ncbi:MAG: RNA-binding S4 domain-containing protein [Clostridiales bacterium]|nr:RNA-binding S4 domain-containing protein [Clostridiales bacterium]
MKDIKISGEFIKLDQFLKYVGIASTGGHAKYLISEGFIDLNGHKITERGKKIRIGDVVRIHIEEESVYKTFKIVSQ